MVIPCKQTTFYGPKPGAQYFVKTAKVTRNKGRVFFAKLRPRTLLCRLICQTGGKNLLLFSAMPVPVQFTLIFLSHQWKKCHALKYFGQRIEFFGKRKKILVLGTYTDPDPDRHALNAGHHPDPTKRCGSNPIRIRQNDADPTQSGPTTLVRWPLKLNVVFD
jgi:hypothetical protein